MRWSFGRSSVRVACNLLFVEQAAGLTCKVEKIRAVWAAGDQSALRIAARFFERSKATKTFKRGMGAYNHPNFYRQLGQSPEKIVANALAVLQVRFNLPA